LDLKSFNETRIQQDQWICKSMAISLLWTF
jgi:hypothetical protein